MPDKTSKYAADTKVVCPDCGELVHVAFRGPLGLVEHQGKAKCLSIQAKKVKESKQKDQPTLLRFGLLTSSKTKPTHSVAFAPPMLTPVSESLLASSASNDFLQRTTPTTHTPTSIQSASPTMESPDPLPQSCSLPQCIEIEDSDEEILEIGSLFNDALGHKPPKPNPEMGKKTGTHLSTLRLPCDGIPFNFASGQSPFLDYPYALHDSLALPWGFEVHNRRMKLRSNACNGYLLEGHSTGVSVCNLCAALKSSQVLRGIQDRLADGSHENTSWNYLSVNLLHELLRRKSNQIDNLRSQKLSQAWKLISRTQNLEEHKKFIIALGTDQSVQRVGALVAVAVKHKLGIRGIIERFWKAAQGLYRPKGYTEEEKMKCLLFYRLGGVRVANIAHRTLQLPALSSIQHYKMSSTLRASSLGPTASDIEYNLNETFGSIVDILGNKLATDYILMIDEIKIEERPRLDALTGKVLGICREHGSRVALSIDSVKEIKQLFDAVDKKEVHIASECTVIAIGLLSPDKRLYAARPIVISGTCKHEKSKEHTQLIQTVTQVCKRLAPKLGLGRLVCLTSDGEARRGASFSDLTLAKPIQPDSALFPLLSGLQLFNTLVGEDDLTGDKDYKHIFKRLRNLLIGSLGTFIDGVHITPAVLRLHLGDCGVAKTRIDCMLRPDDKQDVTLAVQLLRSISSISAPDSDAKPAYARSRRALNLLGLLVDLILKPYIDVSLTLSEQLEHLSAAAHLTFWLYIRATKATRFLPVQLYGDIMIMIKNAYICFSKAKVKDPKGSFWLILLGTDRLESAFGIVRTMVGNDANTDTLQLASRLSNATTCANILAEHPEWDRAPRRLKLRSIDSSVATVTSGVDHIGPGAWRGDMCVEHVHPLTTWRSGRQLLHKMLPDAIATVIESTLTTLSSNPAIDILSPFGELVLNRSQESTPVAIAASNIGYTVDSSNQGPRSLPVDPSHLDLEDLAGAEIAKETPGSPSPYLTLENGESIHKARAISWIFFNSRRNSTDRLSRVAGLSKYSNSTKTTDICGVIDHETALGEPALHVNDPAATLLRCGTHIFLALVQVNQLQFDGISVLEMTSNRLHERLADATAQILCLSPCSISCGSHNEALQMDWRWTQQYGPSIRISGRFIQPVNPALFTSDTCDATYIFSTDDLLGITGLLADRLSSQDFTELPQIAQSDQFPYIYAGKACFLYKKEADAHDPNGSRDHNACPACITPTVLLNRTKAPQVLEHMGAHILFDASVNRAAEPCGFCLRSSANCQIYLMSGKGKDASLQIDLNKSNACPYATKFSYKAASQSKSTSPCSNVPLKCSLCSQASPAVWRYNLKAHYQSSHPLADQNSHLSLSQLSASELAAMKIVWDRRRIVPKTQFSPSELTISEAHSSRMILRTIELPKNDEQPTGDIPQTPELRDNELSESEDQMNEEMDESDNPSPDLDPLFNSIAVSSRSGRTMRQRQIIDEITACYPCNIKVTDEEIQMSKIPGTEPRVMMCSNRQCETKWLHLDCYNFSYVPKDWDCGEHGNSRSTGVKRWRFD